ncbi:MAG: glycosyltransferase [Chthoniobacterales bacterium]
MHDVMLKVWGEHVAWMRHYLISSAANLPDKDDVTVRLMRNQEDIGRAFTPYYGVAAGEKLTALLKDHVRIAADIIAAAKAGDNARQNEAAARWNKNADEIASFLHALNPKYFPLEEMRTLMRDHLQLTSDVIGARVHCQWADDVSMHDKVYRQMLMLADTLSAGIAKQLQEQTSGPR